MRRRLWIEALESGRYRKTQGYLRKGGLSYCALGVAMVVYEGATGSQLGWVEWDRGVLPRQVAEWYGTGPNPDVPTRTGLEPVTTFNDRWGKTSPTFPEIARLLRQKWQIRKRQLAQVTWQLDQVVDLSPRQKAHV